jgi:predicted amidohydrolase YtcJ
MSPHPRPRLHTLCFVGALLAIAPVLAQPPGTRDESPVADLVVKGGAVLTLGPAAPSAAAVSIRDGRISALSASRSGQTLEIPGGVIMPGLIDHHVHLLNVGLWLLNDRDHGAHFLDLSGVKSLAEVEDVVRARAATLPAGAWVTGAGWSQGVWGTEALPTFETLEAAAAGHPVFLVRTDGHAGWVNRAALAAGGVSNATPDPPGGRVVRDNSGHLTGVLLERANELLTPLLPEPADADVMTAFRLATDALAAHGVVEVEDAGVLRPPGVVALNEDFGRYLELLRKADAAAPLAVRVNLMIPAPSRLAESLLASGHRWQISPRIRITHLKLFADGALGSRGAALTHPSADDPSTTGVPRMTTDGIAALARSALDAGLDVATHAIGDEAVRRTLDAYERLLREQPSLDPARLRIEHFSYAREEDFARAVRLHVVLSIQSDFNASPADSTPLGSARTGAANEPRVYAWRRLHEMGATLIEGSDYFMRLREPFAGYRDALTLRYAVGDGRADPAVRTEALAMQVVQVRPGGAPDAGVVGPGARADLVVVDEDPLLVPAGRLPRLRVLATINAGRITYRAQATARHAVSRQRRGPAEPCPWTARRHGCRSGGILDPLAFLSPAATRRTPGFRLQPSSKHRVARAARSTAAIARWRPSHVRRARGPRPD